MSIQILSSEVINQIAAGEVVERPSHLLKELIENSIDATATRIEIYFSQGGRGVEVIDNGQGISEQDLAKSLDRFATSKISNSEDIWQLRTFGFRGEALASIASVSDLLISSRPAEQKQAYQLRSRFGQKSNLEKTGNLNGTRIKIDNLFENTPARLKFLKSDSAEASAIKNTLKALALSHPAVEFKIQENNDLIFYWPVASSRRQRVQQILEETELFTGQAERQGYHAEAIFSSPHKVFKTSKNIWLFVQNRWVQDRSLQAAVMEAYRNLLMHKEYPLAVVWLDVPLDQVDVNIHPTKSQVKFVDASLAFRAVQASIRDVLETAPWLQGSAGGPQFSAKDYSFSSGAGAANENHLADRSQSMVAGENLKFIDPTLMTTQFAQKKSFNTTFQEPNPKWEDLQKSAKQRNLQYADLQYKSSVDSVSASPSPARPDQFWSQLQVLGQAQQTYIITQKEDRMVIVDQHAAHERVVFEKLMQAWNLQNQNHSSPQQNPWPIQDYLFPLAIDLSIEQSEALLKMQNDLEKLGVFIEALGPSTIGVKAAPSFIKEAALSQTLTVMAQEVVDQGGSYKLENTIADVFASLACHSAVRAGQALSLEQMKALLVEMDEFPLSSFCPHGRPVSVEYSFIEMEKDFGRRV